MSGNRLARSEVEARATLQERLRRNAEVSTVGDWFSRVEERHSIGSNDRCDLTFHHDGGAFVDSNPKQFRVKQNQVTELILPVPLTKVGIENDSCQQPQSAIVEWELQLIRSLGISTDKKLTGQLTSRRTPTE